VVRHRRERVDRNAGCTNAPAWRPSRPLWPMHGSRVAVERSVQGIGGGDASTKHCSIFLGVKDDTLAGVRFPPPEADVGSLSHRVKQTQNRHETEVSVMNSSRGSRMASFGSAIWIYLFSSLSKLRAEAAQVGSIGQELAQHERPGKLRRPICEDEHLEARHAGEGERGAPGGPHATGEPCQPGGAPQHDQGVEQ
jgi:hypothetical protein